MAAQSPNPPPPPLLSPLAILQWNVRGLRGKISPLLDALDMDNIDIAILQETLLPAVHSVKFRKYNMYHSPCVRRGTRGVAILVKKSISQAAVAMPIDCGDGVEVVAVSIPLPTTSLTVYNIYRCPHENTVLDLGELFEFATRSPTFIGGDFNAHHARFAVDSTPVRRNVCGIHLDHLLQEFQDVSLLNGPEPTHELGNMLDLTFVSKFLTPRATWCVHPSLSSDHYALHTVLHLPLVQPFVPSPRLNFKKADWNRFHAHLTSWYSSFTPPADINDLERCVTEAFCAAANASIPLSDPAPYRHRNHWYYNDRVKELRHRVNRARKTLRKYPSPANLELYRDVVRLTREEIHEIRQLTWQQWCESINACTSLKEMWSMLCRARGGRRPTVPLHPDPQSEAETLMRSFASRCATSQLPGAVQCVQTAVQPQRSTEISVALATPATTDCPYTPAEVKLSLRTGHDTAAGEDGVTYSMIRQSGEVGLSALTTLLNRSWDLGVLPASWKKAVISPIPKPTDPGQLRPISLLSCLSKTCEKAVLKRLQFQLGPLHPNIFAYRRKTGTAENISTILSLTDNTSAIVVFLDLEKAFELASADAILLSLARKGVSGSLLRWLQDFLSQRQACTRFQGRISETLPLENGTPQGSILSPTLFNVLIENLVSLPFRVGVRLLAYADDLQLVATGRHKNANAQHALKLIESKCAELALKINHAKSKAVPFGKRVPEYSLTIQNHPLQWVGCHTCLGIPFASADTPKVVLTNLLTRAGARLAVLRSLASIKVGAGYHVLRAFYIHAIRSLVDYAAPALLTLRPSFFQKLETIQNRAMRVCLGAPMWTRLENLRLETNLIPLRLRIRQLVAGCTLKALRAPRQFAFKEKIMRNFDRHPALLKPTIWSHAAVIALRSFNLPSTLQITLEDSPHPQFVDIPPWSPLPATFVVTPLPGPKALCSPATIKAISDRVNATGDDTTARYFTDGSVDTFTGRAGAAVHCATHTASWRVSDHASSMQAELLALNQALRHALLQPKLRIEVLTDSLASMYLLQKRDFFNHTRLLTTTFVSLQALQRQGKTVQFTWIPSHWHIRGNDLADEAAKSALHLSTVTLGVLPSTEQIKGRVIKEAWRITLAEHYSWVVAGSPSATWYRDVTRCEPPSIPKTMPRNTAVVIHRLRLGFKCFRELDDTLHVCDYCEEATASPLLHYLLNCHVLSSIRPPELEDYPIDAPDVLEHAVRAALLALEHHRLISCFPPPR